MSRSSLLILAFLSLVVALSASPNRPQLSETFHALGQAQKIHNDTIYFGEATWSVDQPAGKVVEDINYYGAGHLNVWDLMRYDLRKHFWMSSKEKKTCYSEPIQTVKMPSQWDWIEKAEFQRTVSVDGEQCNVWSYTTAGITLEVTVPTKDPNRLVLFSSRSSQDYYRFLVLTWSSSKPSSSVFDVPRSCSS